MPLTERDRDRARHTHTDRHETDREDGIHAKGNETAKCTQEAC